MTDTPNDDAVVGTASRRPDGPNAAVLSLISLALSLVSVAAPLAISGESYPRFDTPASVVANYFTHSAAATLGGVLTFAASVPLGIAAATFHARLLRLGVRVPGPHIAFFGGIAASILLSLTGLLIWTLGTASAGVPAEVVRLLNQFAFALGGFGFVGGLGLLVAGVAVPVLILRLVPRWLAWVGLVIAALSELSFLGLFLPSIEFLLPIGRFVGLLWLVTVGFLLPRSRHEVPRQKVRP